MLQARGACGVGVVVGVGQMPAEEEVDLVV